MAEQLQRQENNDHTWDGSGNDGIMMSIERSSKAEDECLRGLGL